MVFYQKSVAIFFMLKINTNQLTCGLSSFIYLFFVGGGGGGRGKGVGCNANQ